MTSTHLPRYWPKSGSPLPSTTRAILHGGGAFSHTKLETGVRLAVVVVDADDIELNENDAWHIVYTALNSIIKRNGSGRPVAPRKLIEEADKEAAKHFRRRPIPYVLVSSLTIDSFPCQKIRVGGCEVASLKTRRRYPKPIVLEMQHLKNGDATSGQLVRVMTEGRTINAATEHALRALNLLRGLWTLGATFQSWTIGSSSRLRKPIGIIHVGPHHTLHYPDGVSVDEMFWFDPYFSDKPATFKPQLGWNKLETWRRWALSRLNRLAYRDALENLIVRYSHALDYTIHDVAFLHMWSMLERLTNTAESRYDKMIQRIVWMSEERGIKRELLRALHSQRNQYVHSGSAGENADQTAYLVKLFIDEHLLRLLRNDFDVKSLEEYAEYLDFPSDTETLRKKQRQLGRALRVRRASAASSEE